MKTYPDIIYSHRPDYWTDVDPIRAILRNVKGTNRRRMIHDFWMAGRLQELDPVFLKNELSVDERQRLGRIHPSFMGGEYLPPFLANETEVVRIQLASTTSDVISVRARLEANGMITFRIVDEYPDDGDFICTPSSSTGPLSLGEMIELMDTGRHTRRELDSGVVLANLDMNAEDSDRESLGHFVTVSSEFYDQIGRHYDAVFEDWVNDPSSLNES